MKKYEYPIITMENFDEVSKKLVMGKKLRCNTRGFGTRYERWKALRVKAPSTRDEFYEFTKNMFGEGMELKDYEARPGFNSKTGGSNNPLLKLWSDRYGWRLIGGTAFGNQGTGGWDYGSYDDGIGYRAKKRIKKMFSSTLTVAKESSNQT